MAKISIMFGGEQIGVYELDQPATTFGRDPGCTIAIDNLGISRQHCQFVQRGDVFLVQDMNSANGTFVNGKRVGEHYLNDGDEVGVGKYVITFHNQTQTQGQKRTAGVAEAMAASAQPMDALNTYVMDGQDIQAKIAAMKKAAAEGGGVKTAAQYGAAMSGGTAGSFGASMSATSEEDMLATAKKVQIAFLAWAVIATILAIVFGYMAFSTPETTANPDKKKAATTPVEADTPADEDADTDADAPAEDEEVDEDELLE